MNALELVIVTLPGWVLALTLSALILLAMGAGWMMALRLGVAFGWQKVPGKSFRFNPRLLTVAYDQPKLLRVSQSPCWPWVLLLAFGLSLAILGILRPGPAARVQALNHQAYQLNLKGALTEERLGEIQEEQRPWIHLVRSGAELWSPFRGWRPPDGADRATVYARAARAMRLSRVWLVAGGLFSLVGGILALYQGSRESKGPRDHGQAAMAARKEVVYDPSGYFIFPLQVLQRGGKDYAQVHQAPYTVARPPASTCAVHLLIIGNSGSGKGAYLGGHIFATCTVPIVYFDFKGEMPAFRLRPSMLRWGFPGERPKGLPSLRFNFVEWVLTHEDPDTAAKALAGAILPANSQKESENQWIKDTAIPILAQGITAGRWANLAELADEIEHTPLPELLQNIETGRGRMFSMEGKNVPNYAANDISNNTMALLSGRARHIVTASDFSIEEALRNGIYVMGQAANEHEKRLLKIFWAVFWFELLRKGTALPLCVFIDEGVAAGPIPRVLDALVTLRDRGVSLVQCFQFRSGITDVYGRDKAEAVTDGHQTKIYLTKGLADGDITQVSKNAKTWTAKVRDRFEARPLLPEDELKRHARQEKFWAYIDGVQWSTSGRPVMASLVPITPDGWNWRASESEYEAELERLAYGSDYRSPYRMKSAGVVEKDQKRYRHWVPMFEPEASLRGITEKMVLLGDVSELAAKVLGAAVAAPATRFEELEGPPPGVEEEAPADFF